METLTLDSQMHEEKYQITKKQHFVPQFYLKKFINSNNNVEVLDCKNKKIISPYGIKGICYEEFFYGMKTGEQDGISQQIEGMFQKMEDWIAKGLDAVILKILNNEQILDDEKWLIAFLMSMLWIRGPIMRKQINTMSEKVMKHVNLFHFSHPEIDGWFDQIDEEKGKITSSEEREEIKKMVLDGEYSLEFNNYHHIAMFDSFKGFANLFFGQYWTVFISKCKKKFVTSDNPIAVLIPKQEGFYGASFLERTHCFALTPEIYILARNPMKASGNKLRRESLFEKDERKILNLNMVLCARAVEYVYASEAQILEDILNFSRVNQKPISAS